MGAVGVGYGLFILKVANLGFKMNDKRSLAWKAFTIGTPLVFPYLLSFKLEENGRMRKFQEFDEKHPFDPIESYIYHLNRGS